MATGIQRTLKDFRYLLSAEDWEAGESIAHGGITDRFERLEQHGWITDVRDGWFENHPDSEHQRAAPATIATLTERGKELRAIYTLDDIRTVDTVGELLQSVA